MPFFLHQPWKNGKTPQFSCVPFGLRNRVKIVAGVCQGSIRCLSGIYQGSVRGLSGVDQGSVCQGSVRGLSGVCLSGVCQGSVRDLSGVCQGSVRQKLLGESYKFPGEQKITFLDPTCIIEVKKSFSFPAESCLEALSGI